MALPQLNSNVVQPLGRSRSAFYRAVDSLPAGKAKRAPTDVLQELKRCSAIPAKTSLCDLVTLATAAQLLQALQVPRPVVESLLY